MSITNFVYQAAEAAVPYTFGAAVVVFGLFVAALFYVSMREHFTGPSNIVTDKHGVKFYVSDPDNLPEGVEV